MLILRNKGFHEFVLTSVYSTLWWICGINGFDPFGKGIGFALLNDIDGISKIEEHLGKSKIIDYDHTNLLTRKFRRLSENLKKKTNLI